MIRHLRLLDSRQQNIEKFQTHRLFKSSENIFMIYDFQSCSMMPHHALIISAEFGSSRLLDRILLCVTSQPRHHLFTHSGISSPSSTLVHPQWNLFTQPELVHPQRNLFTLSGIWFVGFADANSGCMHRVRPGLFFPIQGLRPLNRKKRKRMISRPPRPPSHPNR